MATSYKEKRKNAWTYALITFLLLLGVALIVVASIVIIRNSRLQVQVVEYETIKEVPVWSERVNIDGNVEDAEAQERLILGEEIICQFADDFTAEGLTVPSGTKVTGPALAKPVRDLDWGVPIYIGETYTTVESDEVIWLLNGDNACVDSQSPFFTYWNKDNPTN